MAMDDIGALRSIPSLMIVEPCDGEEFRQMIPAILYHDGPVYLRCGRKVLPDVHDSTYKFSLDRADIVRKGKDITIFASGVTVADALEAARQLALTGVEAEVINIHTIKPIDADMIIASVQKTGAAIVVENHNVLGGVGSAVSEVVTQSAPVLVERLGYQDVKGEVGTIQSLKARFGIDVDSITAAIKRMLSRS
jgi:transketolase